MFKKLVFTLFISSILIIASAQQYSLDGTGNNEDDPSYGSSGDQFLRQLPVGYPDNMGSTLLNHPDINPRYISNSIFKSKGYFQESEKANSLFVSFSEFIYHDLVKTEDDTSDELDIDVPKCDEQLDTTCSGDVKIEYFRKKYIDDDDNGNARIQLNYQTSFLDLSNLYGVSTEENEALRTGSRGFMEFDEETGCPPLINTKLRLLGNSRGNRNPGILSVYCLFVKEHNRLAQAIRSSDSSLSDDEIFEQARHENIAQYQSIVINEFFPVLTGAALDTYSGYDESIRPGIENFFGHASFLFWQTMQSGVYKRYVANFTASSSGGHIVLRDAYFDTYYLQDDPVEDLLRGGIEDPAQNVTSRLADDLRNDYDGGPSDLGALTILQSRDHGLPTYNEARAFYGLRERDEFSELSNRQSLVESLSQLYGDIDDMDAYVGGISEFAENEGVVGPLFAESIKQQFNRIRNTDRFWFENIYSGDELEDLESVTMLDIIERNFEGFSGASEAFRPISYNNDTVIDEDFRLIALEGYKFGWKFEGEDIYMKFETTHKQWIGLGLCSHTMTNADIIHIDPSENDIKVWDRYSTRNARPSTDADLGGVENFQIVKKELIDTGYQVIIKRSQITGDPFDCDITPNSLISAIYAKGSTDDINYHGKKNRGSINIFFTSDPFDDSSALVDRVNSIYIIHGLILYTLWGILVPFTIYFTRYMKHGGWFSCHKTSMRICVQMTLPIGLLGMLGSSFKDDESARLHQIFGLTLGLGVLLQNILGGNTKKLHNESKPGKKMYNFSQLHKSVGRLLGLLGLVNCNIGVWLLERELLQISIYYTAFVLGSFAMQESWRKLIARRWFKWYKQSKLFKKKEVKDQLKQIKQKKGYQKVVQVFSTKDFWDMISRGAKLTVLQEKIYDLGAWMKTHPGGSYVLQNMVGQDCTTFFTGSSTITTESRSFKHPPTVQSTLNKIFVGFLGDEKSVLIDRNHTHEGQIQSNIREGHWELVARKTFPGNAEINHYTFRSKRFKVEWNVLNVSNFGKHVNIYDKTQDFYRPYTVIMSYTDIQKYRFVHILDYVRKNSEDEELIAALEEILMYRDGDEPQESLIKNKPTNVSFSESMVSKRSSMLSHIGGDKKPGNGNNLSGVDEEDSDSKNVKKIPSSTDDILGLIAKSQNMDPTSENFTGNLKPIQPGNINILNPPGDSTATHKNGAGSSDNGGFNGGGGDGKNGHPENGHPTYSLLKPQEIKSQGDVDPRNSNGNSQVNNDQDAIEEEVSNSFEINSSFGDEKIHKPDEILIPVIDTKSQQKNVYSEKEYDHEKQPEGGGLINLDMLSPASSQAIIKQRMANIQSRQDQSPNKKTPFGQFQFQQKAKNKLNLEDQGQLSEVNSSFESDKSGMTDDQKSFRSMKSNMSNQPITAVDQFKKNMGIEPSGSPQNGEGMSPSNSILAFRRKSVMDLKKNPMNAAVKEKNKSGAQKKIKRHISQTLEVNERDFALKYDVPCIDYSLTKDPDLHFIIRTHKKGKMTNHLLNLKPNDRMFIRGPIGIGLGLTEKSFGKHAGFANGTGVLSFLDLVAFLSHQKIAEAFGRELYSEEEVEFYKNALKDFHLTLFVCIRHVQSAIGMRYLIGASEIHPEKFRLYLYVDDDPEAFEEKHPLLKGKLSPRFTEEFVRQHVPRDVKKVYLSGHEKFNNKIGDYLEAVGFSHSKHFFV